MRPLFTIGLLFTLGLATLGRSSTPGKFSQVVTRSANSFANDEIRRRDEFTSIGDMLISIGEAADCADCQALLIILQSLANRGGDTFTTTIINACKGLKIEDDDVCEGAIGLEGPILTQDLQEMVIPSKTSQLFCLNFFGRCPWPTIDTDNKPVLSEKPANVKRPQSSGHTPLKVVHISDIHVDRNYTSGANYNCTKPICCRPYTPQDQPGNTQFPAGPFGNPACDSPVSLEDSLYDAINSLVPDRAFSIFTGDVVDRAVWLVSEDGVVGGLNDAYGKMAGIGQTYAVVGNHDTAPVNSFPPKGLNTTITTNWPYDTMSSDVEHWIGNVSATQISSNFGSYSVLAENQTNLRIISVNTNFWYLDNFWMYQAEFQPDPSGTFAWLVSELDTAEKAGQRVWIIGHIPLGTQDVFHDASYYYDTIIQRYEATIAAVFYGHTHQDEFQIAYSDYTAQSANTATMMSYIAPALTPTSGNPTFRVYDVDPITFGVLDFTVYYANISDPSYQTKPTWQALYSAKKAYGEPLGVTTPSEELTAAFWHNVTQLFENDDDTFQQYYQRKSRDFNATQTCTGSCKTSEICQLRAAQAQYNCGVIKEGINFGKRNEKSDTDNGVRLGAEHKFGGHREHTCESSSLGPVLDMIFSPDGLNQLRISLLGVRGAPILEEQVRGIYGVG